MAFPPNVALILVTLTSFLLFITPQVQSQSPTAPAPAPPGPINLTGVLDKAGQFTTLIRLLTATQIANQIENQLNNSQDGMTVFAPTDNAFTNLKPGTINGLSTQQQVQLVLYHVLPKFYSFDMFDTVSNPVRTQASGQDGGVFRLNFTTAGVNQVNVSTGIVETQLNNVLRKEFPLAVYQVDKVLLPFELFGPKPPASAPLPSKTPSETSKKAPALSSQGPSASKDDNSGSAGRKTRLGYVVGIGLMCIGVLS